MHKPYQVLYVLLSILAFSSPSLSEVVGVLNASGNSVSNVTIVTGLLGYTVQFCNSDADCSSYKCFSDYDGTASGSSVGWCYPSSTTGCYHDGNATSTGSNICITNTTYRSCSSGTWSSVTSCSSGQTCSSGTCSTPSSTTTTTTSSSTTTNTTTTKASISLTLNASSLTIVQGKSAAVSATVKNTGSRALSSAILSITGVSTAWYSIDPSSIPSIPLGGSRSFNISIAVPIDAEVKAYVAVINVTTNETGARNSTTLGINVTPSASTYVVINQTYLDYKLLTDPLDTNITDLENRNATAEDVQALRSLLDTIRSKMNQSQAYIDNGDYFNAKLVLDEVKNLMSEFNDKVANVRFQEAIDDTGQPPSAGEPLPIWVYVVVIAAIAVIVYLFWPSKKQTLFTAKQQKVSVSSK